MESHASKPPSKIEIKIVFSLILCLLSEMTRIIQIPYLNIAMIWLNTIKVLALFYEDNDLRYQYHDAFNIGCFRQAGAVICSH